MKDNNLCFYCLGCNAEECEDFEPKMNCEGFVPAYSDWQKRYYERLKNNKTEEKVNGM